MHPVRLEKTVVDGFVFLQSPQPFWGYNTAPKIIHIPPPDQRAKR